jgi:DNA topoisomerase-3
MRILCVAEKNSISKAVAQILGGGRVQTRKSDYKYVMNYEFEYEFPHQGRCNVVMTAVAGHVSGCDFPDNFAWGKVNPGRLFEAPIVEKANEDQQLVAKNIAKLSRNCDQLMIWTDCDREGEYIGYEILEAARKGNQRLTLENTWRAEFSHLERSHILQAARNPRKLDKKAIDAVRTRMELDLRTGAAFTRFLTGVFDRYKTDNKGVISYGSCQFPTLGFVVDRYKRVKYFKPEDFWHIDVAVKKDDNTVKFAWNRTRLFDRLATVLLYQKCMKSDKAKITSVKSSPTSKWKPLPLTTVQLQKCCSMYFKMSAKESLDTAEKLYQSGFISYPRTETDKYPQKMDLKDLISKQTQSEIWGEYAKGLLEKNKFRQPRAGRHDDEAHPPIHPVTFTNGTQFKNAKEKTVYEFIVRHYLATCSEDAKGLTNSVELTWGDEKFSASGLTVIEENFLEIYKYQTWKSSVELPRFDMNEEVSLHSAEVKSGKTQAPSLMTETELITLMDANGIGTDATIAEHIEKIVAREYITKQTKQRKQVLVPTVLGMGLVEGFEKINLNNSLTKPFLRKNMEDELKKICEGSKTKNQVSEEMVHLYKDSFAMSVQRQNVILDTYVGFRREATAAAAAVGGD